MPISIAIDGHSGSGKSTLAKSLADNLHYIYIDTGALYRAITLKTITLYKNSFDDNSVIKLLASTKLDIAQSKEGNIIMLDGQNVTESIRRPDVSDAVSRVSAIPEVRKYLVGIQRKIAKGKNVVIEGRDTATVVIPKAQFKFFITANADERAKRRWLELKEKGIETSIEDVKRNLIQRDTCDSSRKTSPLKKADGAIEVDSSDKTPEEMLKFTFNIIKNTLWQKNHIMHTIYRDTLKFIAKIFFNMEIIYEDFDSIKTFSGIVASNHCSNFDPPIVGSAIPAHLNYLGKKELLSTPIRKFILAPCNIIPIDRIDPTPSTIKKVLEVLSEGKSLTIFPEGTRSPDGKIQQAKSGAGMIVYKAKTPILPVYLSGTFGIMPKGSVFPRPGKIRVYVGKPFAIDFQAIKTAKPKDAYMEISELMLSKIKELKNKFEP